MLNVIARKRRHWLTAFAITSLAALASVVWLRGDSARDHQFGVICENAVVTIHGLGSVREGLSPLPVGAHPFTLTNVSKERYAISLSSKSCGCFAVMNGDELVSKGYTVHVSPGRSTTFSIILPAESTSAGEYKLVLDAISPVGVNHPIELLLNVRYHAPIRADTKVVVLDYHNGTAAARGSTVVTCVSDRPVAANTRLSVNQEENGITAETKLIACHSLGNGLVKRDFQVDIVAKSPLASDPVSQRTMLTFNVNSGSRKADSGNNSLVLNVIRRRQFGLELPKRIVLNLSECECEKRVLIRALGGRTFAIKGCTSSLPNVNVKYEGAGESAHHWITARVKKSIAIAASESGHLTISTDMADSPVVSIPIVTYWREPAMP